MINRNVDTLEAAAELIDWYWARWEIELLFLIWNEGCRREVLKLSTLQRLERALARFLIVPWRIGQLTR